MSEMEPQSRESPSSTPNTHAICNKIAKPTKPPPITPRRFKKFFTPISTSRPERGVRTSRRVLRHITNPPGCRRDEAHYLKTASHPDELEHVTENVDRVIRSKRKLSFASVEAPPRSSPLQPQSFFLPSSQENPESRIVDRQCSPGPALLGQRGTEDKGDELDELHSENITPISRRRVRRFHSVSDSGYLLSARLSGVKTRQQKIRSVQAQCETGSFFSNSQDAYFSGSQAYGHPILPFCSASCNTNSLIAVGDEEGGIRILESSSHSQPAFSRPYLTFKPHENAIMDLDFSSDDTYLVTGSGDQTCKVIDMVTQQTLHTLSGHCSSIKRVHFQPESNDRVLASCGRDGNVNIWDLRTRNGAGPMRQLRCTPNDVAEEQAPSLKFDLPTVLLRDSIRGAHADGPGHRKAVTGKPKPSHRQEEASVTSLVFLGCGREHLMVTSSEADATVKLWDLRMTYDTRRTRPRPLSTTRQPESHQAHRKFGLTSMALSTDSARLYTFCRDHTIYTYSTSHLALGHAPELTTTSIRARRAGGAEREGLGPIYGFRHQQLEASTFYVKLSVRRQCDDKTEILAAGSGSDCAVIFPTDERSLPCKPSSRSLLDQRQRPRQGLDSGFKDVSYSADDIPIYQHGTALIRGHRKEVTASTWTQEGQLITVSDDFHVRRWRQGDEARDLRLTGEGEGRRWMCGWADVDGSCDDDE